MIAQQQLQPWSEQQRGHGNREAQEFHRSFSVRVQTKMDLSQVFDGMLQMRREEDGEFMGKEKKGVHSSGAERARTNNNKRSEMKEESKEKVSWLWVEIRSNRDIQAGVGSLN